MIVHTKKNINQFHFTVYNKDEGKTQFSNFEGKVSLPLELLVA